MTTPRQHQCFQNICRSSVQWIVLVYILLTGILINQIRVITHKASNKWPHVIFVTNWMKYSGITEKQTQFIHEGTLPMVPKTKTHIYHVSQQSYRQTCEYLFLDGIKKPKTKTECLVGKAVMMNSIYSVNLFLRNLDDSPVSVCLYVHDGMKVLVWRSDPAYITHVWLKTNLKVLIVCLCMEIIK